MADENINVSIIGNQGDEKQKFAYRGKKFVLGLVACGTLALGYSFYDMIAQLREPTSTEYRAVAAIESNQKMLDQMKRNLQVHKPEYLHSALDTRLPYYPKSMQDSLDLFFESNRDWEQFLDNADSLLERNRREIADSAYLAKQDDSLKRIHTDGYITLFGLILAFGGAFYEVIRANLRNSKKDNKK